MCVCACDCTFVSTYVRMSSTFKELDIFSMDNFGTYNYGQTKLETNVQTMHFNIFEIKKSWETRRTFSTFEE